MSSWRYISCEMNSEGHELQARSIALDEIERNEVAMNRGKSQRSEEYYRRDVVIDLETSSS